MATRSRTAGLILAAGDSQRMGQAKALLHVGGRAILEGLIAEYSAARLERIAVVGSGAALALVRDDPRVRAVEGDPQAPMIDSVARGLAVLGSGIEAAIVQPVDAPFTTAEMIAALRGGSAGAARVMCHRGRAGHPILVPRALFAEIALKPEGGLRGILAEAEVELVEWPDAGVLADLDTPADLERWRAYASGQLLH